MFRENFCDDVDENVVSKGTSFTKVSYPRPTSCHVITARPTTRGRVQDIGNRGIAIGTCKGAFELLPLFFCIASW